MRGLIATKPQDANKLGTVKEQKGLWGKSASEFEPSCGDAHLKSSPLRAECRGKKSTASSMPAMMRKG